MNTNNHGWTLCPSKRFPGKFYYFNVLNGEAAWSLTDNEVSNHNLLKITISNQCCVLEKLFSNINGFFYLYYSSVVYRKVYLYK